MPWCARVAAQKLPAALRVAQPAADSAATSAEWAADASVLMALQALSRALPRGWPVVRRVERAAAALGGAALEALDAAPGRGPLLGRLAVAFALYGFSVEPGGPRVCC